MGSSLYEMLLQAFRWWRIRVVQPAVPFGGEWPTVQAFRWRSTFVVNRIDRMSTRSILSCITVASQEAFCLLHQACSVNECVEFQGLLQWTGILLAHIDFWDFDSFSSLPCTVVFTAGMSGVFRLSLTLSTSIDIYR